ncbi:MAG TPA: rhomboid-like protein [Acidimicrobiia bacterium]|nr:rhomboid-like protein [Acidimicrobiia bacterium]
MTAAVRTRRWHRLYRAGADYLAAAPGTHILLLILAVTTLVLRGLDAPTTTRILRHQSTNLFQMSRDAPRVLVLSAFLLDNGRLLVEAAYFTLILAPVERWIGTYRWLATFAAGHVGATLATTVGIWLQVREGAGRSLVYPVDVGVSYGVAAVAGVLVYRLRRPLSLAWLALVTLDIGSAVVGTGTFTDWGHLVAFGIGLAFGPLVRPEPRDRRRVLVVLGAGLLAGAAACGVLLVTVPDRDIAIPESGATVAVTVVGRPPDCAATCRAVVVRYTVPGADGEQATPGSNPDGAPSGRAVDGILILSQQTLTQRGDHLMAVADPATPGRLRPLRPRQRVSPDSLFGAMAVAGGVTGVIVLLLAGRLPRRRSGVPAELHQVHVGGGQVDGVVAADLVPELVGSDGPASQAADDDRQLQRPPQQPKERGHRHQ